MGVHTDPEVETAYFPPSLGFIRLAIQHGLPLFPTYIFGENQLFGQNKFTRAANVMVKRNFGIGSLFVLGRFGLPWPVFKSAPLFWAIGDCIDTGPAEPKPSDERVRDVFVKYVTELNRIFNLHARERLPPGNAQKGLRIVWREHENEIPTALIRKPSSKL